MPQRDSCGRARLPAQSPMRGRILARLPPAPSCRGNKQAGGRAARTLPVPRPACGADARTSPRDPQRRVRRTRQDQRRAPAFSGQSAAISRHSLSSGPADLGGEPPGGRFCAEWPRPILLVVTHETPFAFRVEAHPQRQGRYLWAIGYGFQTYRRSTLSFATKREAENDALKAVLKIEARWRRERDPPAATAPVRGGKERPSRQLLSSIASSPRARSSCSSCLR